MQLAMPGSINALRRQLNMFGSWAEVEMFGSLEETDQSGALLTPEKFHMVPEEERG